MTRFLAGEDNFAVVMSVRDGARASFALGGVYDDGIVCSACERGFHKADTYFIGFWKALLANSIPAVFNFGTHKLRTYKADAALLHMFVMQTLVRFHLSERVDCAEYSLDPWATFLVDRVRWQKSTIEDGPEVMLRFVKSDSAANMMPPFAARLGESELTELMLPHLRIHVGKTSRTLPTAIGANDPCVLRSDRPVTVFHSRRLFPSELDPLRLITEPNKDRVARMRDRK
jgi:hypothetical protein